LAGDPRRTQLFQSQNVVMEELGRRKPRSTSRSSE
jgi:hypothetical protein